MSTATPFDHGRAANVLNTLIWFEQYRETRLPQSTWTMLREAADWHKAQPEQRSAITHSSTATGLNNLAWKLRLCKLRMPEETWTAIKAITDWHYAQAEQREPVAA